MLNRRQFIETTIKSSAVLLTSAGSLPTITTSQKKTVTLPISKTKETLAIAMWDFSWLLRHHRYGEFENWDKVLEELVDRGYNAIRIDVMPQFIAADSDEKVTEVFRSRKEDWQPILWGNDYSMSFRPREDIPVFLRKCKEYDIKVGLATWFKAHGTDRKDIFMEKDGLFRAWNETLDYLKRLDLLDNILYVDVLNEYPFWHGYDWLKNEMNQRSDIRQFKLDNPDAHIPEYDPVDMKGNPLQIVFYNEFVTDILSRLKKKYPELDFFVSLDSGMSLDTINLSRFSALDYHVWFAHLGKIPGLKEISARDQKIDCRKIIGNLNEYWQVNRKTLTNWMNGRMRLISETAAKNNIVCGNTEGWGPIFWYDHPELDWSWVKESAEVCIDLLQAYPNYKFICTSNFTHPQFKGMWEDKKWHRAITKKIRTL